MTTPRRGDIWALDTATSTRVLVISSTVYNEIPTEPTVIAIPILTGEPDTGFGVRINEDQWAATGLITSLRKSRLHEFEHNVGTQLLTDVNNMLFRILATPER
jgi:mRNA-degrading endonuclease toxin of MazEF toxin-antitoxin module